MDKKIRILVIEDDEYTRDIYNETLTEAGFAVETAVDGLDGLLKAQQGGYKLILLDVMMPKKNGIEVLQGLKENPPKTANGIIVLLTNLAQNPVVAEAMTLGAKSYLIKSDMNPDDLVAHVKKFLAS